MPRGTDALGSSSRDDLTVLYLSYRRAVELGLGQTAAVGSAIARLQKLNLLQWAQGNGFPYGEKARSSDSSRGASYFSLFSSGQDPPAVFGFLTLVACCGAARGRAPRRSPVNDVQRLSLD